MCVCVCAALKRTLGTASQNVLRAFGISWSYQALGPSIQKMACIHNITCSELDILNEPALSLVKTVCSQRLSCDDKVYVVVNTSLVCLSGLYKRRHVHCTIY